MVSDRFNGSGCKDPTAYKAIQNLINGGSKMELMYKDGDVVRYVGLNGITEKEAVLIRCHEDYATMLMLTDKKPYQNGLAIRAYDMKYTDCGKLGYVYYNNIVDVIRQMTDQEIEDAKEKIRMALGISQMSEPSVPEVNENGPAPDEIPVSIIESTAKEISDRFLDAVTQQFHRCLGDHDEYLKAVAQRDVYKDLFEKEREYR